MIRRPELRMFVDENGNYSLHEKLDKEENRFLCLTGVAMRSSEHKLLSERLDALKHAYFGDKSIILHRREIIAASGPFASLKTEEIRNMFNFDLLSIMSEIRYGVISVVIDKRQLVSRYGIQHAQDPYALALECLMQRYQYWMQEYSSKKGHIFGDIMAESRSGKEDGVTKGAYRLIYRGEGNIGLKNAEQFFSSKEIKMKKKKDNIAGLQFVDLVSHPARRFILSNYGLARDLQQTSFEQKVVEILVKQKFRRHNGSIIGAGAVLFPK